MIWYLAQAGYKCYDVRYPTGFKTATSSCKNVQITSNSKCKQRGPALLICSVHKFLFYPIQRYRCAKLVYIFLVVSHNQFGKPRAMVKIIGAGNVDKPCTSISVQMKLKLTNRTAQQRQDPCTYTLNLKRFNSIWTPPPPPTQYGSIRFAVASAETYLVDVCYTIQYVQLALIISLVY